MINNYVFIKPTSPPISLNEKKTCHTADVDAETTWNMVHYLTQLAQQQAEHISLANLIL